MHVNRRECCLGDCIFYCIDAQEMQSKGPQKMRPLSANVGLDNNKLMISEFYKNRRLNLRNAILSLLLLKETFPHILFYYSILRNNDGSVVLLN